jgi:AAA domain
MNPTPARTARAPHLNPTPNGPQDGSQGRVRSRAPRGWPGGLEPVPEPPRTAWDAQELMRMSFPDPRWAIPGIVCEGVSLLAGPPKVGKSWLALNLALDIAAGTPALGSIDVDPGPVLYLALEDTARRLQSRMRTVLAGRDAPTGLTLSIACPPMPAGGDAHIADWLDRHPDARMVVIDVFAKVRGNPPAGVAAYDADYAAMSRIKRVADAYGVAVLLVHHVRKQASEDFLATVSGTHGLAGAADAVLVLERARAQADGVLHVTGRDVDETDYPLAFNATEGAWRVLDGPAADYQLRDGRALVMRFLRANPGSRPKAIAEALRLDPAAVRQTCRRMADDGQLRATPSGQYHPADQSASDSGDAGDSTSPLPLSSLSLRHSTVPEQHEPDPDEPDPG